MCVRNFFTVRMMPGLITLSVVTFILGAIFAFASMYAIILEEYHPTPLKTEATATKKSEYEHVFNFHMDKKAIEFISSLIFVISLLTIGSSISLFIGITKNKASCVLIYFSFGTILMILLFLGAVLAFLQGWWRVGTPMLTLFFIYIPCLQHVHTAYEVMHKGMSFGYYGHNILVNEVPE